MNVFSNLMSRSIESKSYMKIEMQELYESFLNSHSSHMRMKVG